MPATQLRAASPTGSRTGTREAILALALDLLQARGFNAFSYQHIADRLGIRKAAVHYHFPTKADLGLALVAHYRTQFEDWRAAQMEKGAGPLDLLRGYMAISLHFLRDGGKACPLGVLEAEFASLPPPLREAVTALDTELREFLAGVLEAGRGAGIFRFDGPAADKVLVITASLQGGLHIARAAGARSFTRMLRQLERDLGITND